MKKFPRAATKKTTISRGVQTELKSLTFCMTRLLQFSISGSHHNSNCWREFEQIAANGICVCCNFLKFPPENLNCGVTLSTENCSKRPVCCNYLERVLTPCPAYLCSLKYLGNNGLKNLLARFFIL